MSMWSDFYGDHAYEIEMEGRDPNELYWEKILGVKKINNQNVEKNKNQFFSIMDHLNKGKK